MPTGSSSAERHRTEATYEHASGLVKIERLWPGGEELAIFDVGCGDARLSRHLADQGHHVIGIDANEQAVAAAREAGIDARLGDAESRWPVEDASQDVVLLLDILEHTVDQERVLGEAKRVLKPEGSILLTYLNHFDLRNRLAMLRGRGIVHWDHAQYDAKPWSYTHYRYLKYGELRELLQQMGLAVDREQFNFMGGGIVPRRGTPGLLRRQLTGRWPELFSGKFIVRCRPAEHWHGDIERIVLEATPPGL